MRDLDDDDLAYFLATGIGDIVRGTRAGGLLHGRSLARVANDVAQDWTDWSGPVPVGRFCCRSRIS